MRNSSRVRAPYSNFFWNIVRFLGLDFAFRRWILARGTIWTKDVEEGVYVIAGGMFQSAKTCPYRYHKITVRTPAGRAAIYVNEEVYHLLQPNDMVLIRYRRSGLDPKSIQAKLTTY